MIHWTKLRGFSVAEWASSHIGENHHGSSKSGFWFLIAQNSRYYGRKRTLQSERGENFNNGSCANLQIVRFFTPFLKKEAQAALLDYFHSTRKLEFVVAENISKNSPRFLKKLFKKFEKEQDIGWSIARFLRNHPINEFEPFFESFGLKPSEYVPLLPRDLMFLSDDGLLLENYLVLFNYGIPLNKIGKIYKEAKEVFQYDYGVLSSKLRAYEELGLDKFTVVKYVVSSPYLLIGNVNVEFVEVLEELKCFGKEATWIEGNLLEGSAYNWRQILGLLFLFRKTGFSEEQVAGLIDKHPGLLFEGSGNWTLTLVGFMVKCGSTMDQIRSMFLQFPQIQVGKFVSNLRQCFLFLNEIEMEVMEIGNIVRSHTLLLGSCTLKTTFSLCTNLSVGKKRIRKIVQENPQVLNNWVLGKKVERLPNLIEESRELKYKFLLRLGFAENSDKMKAAFKEFKGKGSELQERFDCIVKAGLQEEDVSEMVKVRPLILTQPKDVIQMKLDYLVNDMGYPVSSLVAFPSYLGFALQRIKLRHSMYNWLKDQGTANPNLSLSTIVGCSDKSFEQYWVNHHPTGPQVWQDLKTKVDSG